MIHAARKKREMARQSDFIPIEDLETSTISITKSRLAKDDDEDELSDDQDHGQRVSLNFKQKVQLDRQKDRDNFLAYENGNFLRKL
jgi:hypothetical protein